MPDNIPGLDVEAIRARLDAASPSMRVDVHVGSSALRATAEADDRAGFVGAVTDLVDAVVGETGPLRVTFADDEDGQDATFALNAANDIRSLLDENARLNAELSDFREMAVLNTKAHTEALDRARAENERLADECGVQCREAAARTVRAEKRAAILAEFAESVRRAQPRSNHNELEQGWNACLESIQDGLPSAVLAALEAAPEMPRPPAVEAPTEYMVVVPSICGDPTDYRLSYRTDRVRKPNRDAAIEHGLDAEGHDDFLIALVVGDTLTGLAWMTEDRDDAEEIAEAAEALELAAPEPVNGTAQPGAGDTDTSGTGSGRGTGLAEASGTAQESEGDTDE